MKLRDGSAGTQTRIAIWRKMVLVTFIAVGLSNLAAFAVRAWFVTHSGPYAATTGFEEFCLYDIWKSARGFPVYEWPQRDHYLLSFYNCGFYWTYGVWARLWHATSSNLVLCVRLLTPLFALLGMSAQAMLWQRMSLARSRGEWAALFIFGSLTWLGTSFVAWGVLSARPDVPAVALAIGGLAIVFEAVRADRPRTWLAASLFFFAAWSFKQSVLWCFAGATSFALLNRISLRSLIALVGPWAVLVATTVASGGPQYRYNIFVVPHLFAWLPEQSIILFGQLTVLNALLVVPGFALLVKILLHWRTTSQIQQLLACATVPAVLAGFVQLSLRGSSTNNFLEAFVLLATLGGAACLECARQPARVGRLVGGMVLVGLMLPLPVVQLCNAARQQTYTTIHGVSIGNLIKLDSEQLAQRRHFAAWMQSLPSPLWIRDAMLQLPWFATRDLYPTFLINDQFTTDAKAHGAWVGRGVEDWIARRHFGALLLRRDDPLTLAARAAGYSERAIPGGNTAFAGEFGLYGPPPVLFVRDSVPAK